MDSLFTQDHAQWAAAVKRHLEDIAERVDALIDATPRSETPSLLTAHLRTVVATVEAALRYARHKPENRKRR